LRSRATTRSEANFNGFNIYDISNPAAPTLTTSVVCPGGQGDVSVYLYVYVQGTAGVRPAEELPGCEGPPTGPPTGTANPARWRIEVIKVPLSAPGDAAIVNEPRLFRDPATGAVDGLQNAPQTEFHPSGMAWGPIPITDACHDITVYPKLELAAGACEGNGLLIDISDPANPKRIDAVADPLCAYWHGATFSNDGKTVVFTDEWGGGTAPRCRATDQLSWGGNSVYDIVRGKLVFRSYFKIPPVQTVQENCVSHIPSLVPVPGRDIFVQAWYQGGASLVDFSDSRRPIEIGYYDRGPISSTALVLGGLWSTYWYNGATYGSELARGFDVWNLKPTADLSENEIEAAQEVAVDRLNVQHQDKLRWEPSFAVVRSFVDQLERSGELDGRALDKVNKFVDRAERFAGHGQKIAASVTLRVLAASLRDDEFDDLQDALRDLPSSLFRRDHR
jgi:LVIVD repeat